MAEISCKYTDEKYTIDTFKNVLDTYRWIENAIRYVFRDKIDLRIGARILFDTPNKSYTCDSIEDFKRYAFKNQIQIKCFLVSVREDWGEAFLYISAIPQKYIKTQEYVIQAYDEKILADVEHALLWRRMVLESMKFNIEREKRKEYSCQEKRISTNDNVENLGIRIKYLLNKWAWEMFIFLSGLFIASLVGLKA